MVSLTDAQRREFERSGFLVVENAVPDDIAVAAGREVESAIPVDPDDREALLAADNEINVWSEIEDREPFGKILGGLKSYGEELVGEGNVRNLSSGMQIAVRYPNSDLMGETPVVEDLLTGHVDGYNAAYRETGDVQSFTVGTAVYFDDVPPRGGGLTVWPGSHRQVTEYFASNAYDEMESGNFEQVEGSPFEITGSAGTVVLFHNKLVHCGGVNVSSKPRFAGFSRLAHPDIDEIADDAADKPWKYWDRVPVE